MWTQRRPRKCCITLGLTCPLACHLVRCRFLSSLGTNMYSPDAEQRSGTQRLCFNGASWVWLCNFQSMCFRWHGFPRLLTQLYQTRFRDPEFYFCCLPNSMMRERLQHIQMADWRKPERWKSTRFLQAVLACLLLTGHLIQWKLSVV